MSLTMKEKFDRVNLSKLPGNVKSEFDVIKESTDNFDPDLVPIFQENFDILYGVVEKKYPEALKVGGTLKKVKPAKVKKAKAKKNGPEVKTLANSGGEGFRVLPEKKEMVHKSRGKDKTDLMFLLDQLQNSMEHYSQESFADHLSEQTTFNKGMLREVFKAYWELAPKDRDKSRAEWAGWIKPYLIEEVDLKKTKWKVGDNVIYKPNGKQAKIIEIYDKPGKENIEVEIIYPNNATQKTRFNNLEKDVELKEHPVHKGEKKDEGFSDVDDCRKILTEAGYTTKKKLPKTGSKAMKVKEPRPERTIIKDKVDGVFTTISKDISGSKEKDEKYAAMQKALTEAQTLLTKLFNLLSNLAEDNSTEKVEKIISLLKKIVP